MVTVCLHKMTSTVWTVAFNRRPSGQVGTYIKASFVRLKELYFVITSLLYFFMVGSHRWLWGFTQWKCSFFHASKEWIFRSIRYVWPFSLIYYYIRYVEEYIRLRSLGSWFPTATYCIKITPPAVLIKPSSSELVSVGPNPSSCSHPTSSGGRNYSPRTSLRKGPRHLWCMKHVALSLLPSAVS